MDWGREKESPKKDVYSVHTRYESKIKAKQLWHVILVQDQRRKV